MNNRPTPDKRDTRRGPWYCPAGDDHDLTNLVALAPASPGLSRWP
jgi:hypothetical protein